MTELLLGDVLTAGRAVAAGHVSPLELVDAQLARIDAWDPEIGVYIYLCVTTPPAPRPGR